VLLTLIKQHPLINCMWAVIGYLFIEGTHSCSAVDFTRKLNPREGYPFHYLKRVCHYSEWKKKGSLIHTIANPEYFMKLRILNCLFKLHPLKIVLILFLLKPMAIRSV
jgi:hypothetical protein